MITTMPAPTSRHSHRSTPSKRQKRVPVVRVEELLREIVIALHATRPIKKVPTS